MIVPRMLSFVKRDWEEKGIRYLPENKFTSTRAEGKKKKHSRIYVLLPNFRMNGPL